MKQVIFDMDNTLIDTASSYDEAARLTAQKLGGFLPALEDVHALRMSGGFNNDWVLTRELLRRRGVEVAYETVVGEFERFYSGENFDGLIRQERWMLEDATLRTLHGQFPLAIVTGRDRKSADFALRERRHFFGALVTHDDVKNPKPDPEGLLKVMSRDALKHEIVYVGDTVDDQQAARAAGIQFIGVVPPKHAFPEKLKDSFVTNGALAVLYSVNEIGFLLNPRGRA